MSRKLFVIKKIKVDLQEIIYNLFNSYYEKMYCSTNSYKNILFRIESKRVQDFMPCPLENENIYNFFKNYMYNYNISVFLKLLSG